MPKFAGSGRGTAGRAVTSDSEYLQFESSLGNFYLLSHMFLKNENKEKKVREWSIFKRARWPDIKNQTRLNPALWFKPALRLETSIVLGIQHCAWNPALCLEYRIVIQSNFVI